MSEEYLLLIMRAVNKWNCIAYGLTQSHGRHDCPLCMEYYDGDCWGCPIRESNYRCEGTPCMETRSYTYLYDFPEMADAVERQVSFLCSFLPETHAWYEEKQDSHAGPAEERLAAEMIKSLSTMKHGYRSIVVSLFNRLAPSFGVPEGRCDSVVDRVITIMGKVYDEN